MADDIFELAGQLYFKAKDGTSGGVRQFKTGAFPDVGINTKKGG